MKRGLFSVILCFALLASAIVGALGASVLYVSADSPSSSGDLYLDDLYDILLDQYPEKQYQLDTMFDFMDSVFDDSRYVISVLNQGNNYSISVFYNYQNSEFYSYTYGGYSGMSPQFNGSYDQAKMTLRYWLMFTDTQSDIVSFNTNDKTYTWSPFDWSNSSRYDFNTPFPSTYFFNVSGLKVFCSKSLSQGNGSTWSSSQNLFKGSSIPPILDFSLKSFWLGERRYLTISDQSFVRNLDPDKMNDTWYLFNNEDVDYELFDYRILKYENITLIPGGDSFITGLTNVSPLGVYAYDITDLQYKTIQFHATKDQ